MDSGSSEDLVEKAKSGCQRSFGLLVEKYRHRLETLIDLRLWSPLRARVAPEDVFQEAWMNAWLALPGYESREKGSFFQWLARIAEHVILNLARGMTRTPGITLMGGNGSEADDSRPLDPGFIASGPSPSDAMKDRERFERFKAALAKLSGDHREVIILSAVHQLKTREIAERMHRTRDAVSMLFLRAVRELRLHFDDTSSLRLPPGDVEDLRLDLDPPGAPGHNGDGIHEKGTQDEVSEPPPPGNSESPPPKGDFPPDPPGLSDEG